MKFGNLHTIDPSETMERLRIKYRQIMVDKSNEQREMAYEHLESSGGSGFLSGVMLVVASLSSSVFMLGFGVLFAVISAGFFISFKLKIRKSNAYTDEAVMLFKFEAFAKGYNRVEATMSDSEDEDDIGYKLNTNFYKSGWGSVKAIVEEVLPLEMPVKNHQLEKKAA